MHSTDSPGLALSLAAWKGQDLHWSPEQQSALQQSALVLALALAVPVTACDGLQHSQLCAGWYGWICLQVSPVSFVSVKSNVGERDLNPQTKMLVHCSWRCESCEYLIIFWLKLQKLQFRTVSLQTSVLATLLCCHVKASFLRTWATWLHFMTCFRSCWRNHLADSDQICPNTFPNCFFLTAQSGLLIVWCIQHP